MVRMNKPQTLSPYSSASSHFLEYAFFVTHKVIQVISAMITTEKIQTDAGTLAIALPPLCSLIVHDIQAEMHPNRSQMDNHSAISEAVPVILHIIA